MSTSSSRALYPEALAQKKCLVCSGWCNKHTKWVSTDKKEALLTVIDYRKTNLKMLWAQCLSKGSEMVPSLSPHTMRVSGTRNCFKKWN